MRLAIVVALLSAADYYLGYWAKITEFIWSRYPPKFASFMGCAACSGFWYGILNVWAIGKLTGWDYLGLAWYNPVATWIAGGLSLITTPLIARSHLRAMAELSPGGTDAQAP